MNQALAGLGYVVYRESQCWLQGSRIVTLSFIFVHHIICMVNSVAFAYSNQIIIIWTVNIKGLQDKQELP